VAYKVKSSEDWIQRHLKDPYVKKAQRDNYRARSAYKVKKSYRNGVLEIRIHSRILVTLYRLFCIHVPFVYVYPVCTVHGVPYELRTS